MVRTGTAKAGSMDCGFAFGGRAYEGRVEWDERIRLVLLCLESAGAPAAETTAEPVEIDGCAYQLRRDRLFAGRTAVDTAVEIVRAP